MVGPRVGIETVRDAGARHGTAAAYREAVLDVLRRRIGFDHHVWVLTDPVTCVGGAPHATLPDDADLPAVIRSRYSTSRLRWTALTRATRLVDHTAAEPGWRATLAALGVTDVLTCVHRDAHGCWAFLDLWRQDGAFSVDDVALLDGTRADIVAALRRFVGDAMRTTGAGAPADGSGVIVVDDGLRVVGDTAGAASWLARLLPPAEGRDPVPAVAMNVAAQLLAVESGVDPHTPMTRVHVGHGVWLTARAERLGGPGSRIAVVLTPTSPAERQEVHARAFALTARETEVVRLVADGCATREVAGLLHLSEYTVQDHLRSVFDRTGTRTRAALVAQACGR